MGSPGCARCCGVVIGTRPTALTARGSVPSRNAARCLAITKGSGARSGRTCRVRSASVEHNDEVHAALVQSTVREQVLKLAAIRGLRFLLSRETVQGFRSPGGGSTPRTRQAGSRYGRRKLFDLQESPCYTAPLRQNTHARAHSQLFGFRHPAPHACSFF